jgi:hypothetical protein
VSHCKFIGNATGSTGGGGGLAFHPPGNPLVINCLFSSNQAYQGGGMSNAATGASVVNCTFTGNAATNAGGGIYNYSSASLTVTNSIVWGNTGLAIQGAGSTTVAYSCVQGGGLGDGNINVDPRLLADGSLSPRSPCIDAGDNTAVPTNVTTDLAGKPRFFNAPAMPDTGNAGTPGAAIVDMGAYESHGSPKRIYVSAAATGPADGQTWATAYPYLQDLDRPGRLQARRQCGVPGRNRQPDGHVQTARPRCHLRRIPG